MPVALNPKYRILSQEELQGLEKDFIYYLASLGISSDVWLQYQKDDRKKTEEVIIGFSDLILETVYTNCQLLEEVTHNGWLFYRFNDEAKVIDLVGLTLVDDHTLDLRRIERQELLERMEKDSGHMFRLIKAQKRQMKDKASEIDQMIKRGAFLSTDFELYDLLQKLSSGN